VSSFVDHGLPMFSAALSTFCSKVESSRVRYLSLVSARSSAKDIVGEVVSLLG
jgi:hypothetical protein